MLVDIGNTSLHICKENKVISVPVKHIDRYKDEEVWYISVNRALKQKISGYEKWYDLGPYIRIDGEYEGMGVDRKALCMAVGDGVVVDAGSAITVDVMRDGLYQGGFIYPGFWQLKKSYAAISSVLERDFVDISPDSLPKDTAQAVTFGALIPLVRFIETLGGPLYLTGGDGALLKKYLPKALYDEGLIFKGMKKAKDLYVDSSAS